MALEQLNSDESLTNGNAQESLENGQVLGNSEGHNPPDASLTPERLESASDFVGKHSNVFSSQACEADDTTSEVEGHDNKVLCKADDTTSEAKGHDNKVLCKADGATAVKGHDNKVLPIEETFMETNLKEPGSVIVKHCENVTSSTGNHETDENDSKDTKNSLEASSGGKCSQELTKDFKGCVGNNVETADSIVSGIPASEVTKHLQESGQTLGEKYNSQDGGGRKSHSDEDDKEDEDENFAFNEDLLCEEHGE
jgi:hypothetical protein